MAILTDDQDIREVYFRTMLGGNGDYYFELYENEESGMQKICMRFAMSGGNSPSEVKIAVAELHRAMERTNSNEYPDPLCKSSHKSEYINHPDYERLKSEGYNEFEIACSIGFRDGVDLVKQREEDQKRHDRYVSHYQNMSTKKLLEVYEMCLRYPEPIDSDDRDEHDVMIRELQNRQWGKTKK